LEDALYKAPFSPFIIHIDGKNISVEHTDRVLFTPSRATIVVAPSDERIHIIEVDQIKFLTVLPRKKMGKAH
jgi:hypothetical protein